MELEPTLSPRFIVYIRNYLLDQGVDAAPSRKQWSRLLLLWLYRPSPFELGYSELIAFRLRMTLELCCEVLALLAHWYI